MRQKTLHKISLIRMQKGTGTLSPATSVLTLDVLLREIGSRLLSHAQIFSLCTSILHLRRHNLPFVAQILLTCSASAAGAWSLRARHSLTLYPVPNPHPPCLSVAQY